MLTKSTDCRPLKKAAKQGGKPAKKGVYPVVNDRILRAKPTQQAENPSAFLLSEGFSAFVAFVSGLEEAFASFYRCGFPVAMPMISARISSSAVAPMMTFIVVRETLSLILSYSL